MLLTTKQVVVRIAVIILLTEFTTEFLIMMPLKAIYPGPLSYLEVAIDSVVLMALSTPAIYIWVIKPFVDARDEALTQISQLADVDPLTQLPNRRLFSKHLKKVIAGSVRHRVYGALLLLDLDGFKSINDAHGHDAGDALLVEIATRIQSVTRAEDVAARMGGDEFLVIISHLDVDEGVTRDKASLIAKELISLVKMPFNFDGSTLHVGASIGIRLLGFEELDAERAVSDADTAMYRAKQAGKGCAAFFEE